MAYVAVFAVVFLAAFPHGRHKLQTSRSTVPAVPSTVTHETVCEVRQDNTMLGAGAVLLWRHLLAAWLLLMLLLGRAHNMSLTAIVAVQSICSRHITVHLSQTEHCVSPTSLTLLYLFSGQAAFFYQVQSPSALMKQLLFTIADSSNKYYFTFGFSYFSRAGKWSGGMVDERSHGDLIYSS